MSVPDFSSCSDTLDQIILLTNPPPNGIHTAMPLAGIPLQRLYKCETRPQMINS